MANKTSKVAKKAAAKRVAAWVKQASRLPGERI
jgi:hypothetical protein